MCVCVCVRNAGIRVISEPNTAGTQTEKQFKFEFLTLEERLFGTLNFFPFRVSPIPVGSDLYGMRPQRAMKVR